MTRVLALAGQSKIGVSRSGGSPKPGPKPIRNGVPLWTETACRFPPKPPAGLNRNRLSETPKFAARDQPAVLAHQRRARPAPLLDARNYRGDLGIRVGPSIFGIRDQPIDRPPFDLVGRPRPSIAHRSTLSAGHGL